MRDNELTNGSQWEIPGARTKNHRQHLVPLSELARNELRRVTRVSHSPCIFTTNGRTPVSGWSNMKLRLDAAMLKVARQDDPQVTIEPWRLHDLRRTVATGMVSIGIHPHIVEAALNHLSGHKAGVAGIYNVHEYLPEKTAALDRWAAHVEAIVSGSVESNVIPFGAAGA
jgi:integrase